MTCSGRISAFAVNGRSPKHDCHVPDVPALAEHHDTDDGLDLVVGLVDVAGRFASLFEVGLGDLALRVGVDHEYLGFLEAELLRLPEVLRPARQRRRSSPP